MFIDSHAHFSTEDGDAGYAVVLPRAWEAGVDGVVAIGGSEALNAGGLAAAAAFPERVGVALGWGRDLAPRLGSGQAAMDVAMQELEAMIAAHRARVVAVGEIGLDYHYAPETAPAQRVLFRIQLEMARMLGLPVVVHSREADADTLEMLAEFSSGSAGGRGVLHCFTGGERFARALLDIGFYISFSGIVTFRNAELLREVARKIPADRLLIETDSPYLAPIPMRGKRNEPAFLRHVADVLAEARSCEVGEIARITAENARRLFRLA